MSADSSVLLLMLVRLLRISCRCLLIGRIPDRHSRDSCAQADWSVRFVSLQCTAILFESLHARSRVMNDVPKVRAGVVVLAVAIVAACTVGPEYRRPQVVSVDEFVGAGGSRFDNDEIEREFWRAFDDPLLNRLIEEGMRSNHDIAFVMALRRESSAVRFGARPCPSTT